MRKRDRPTSFDNEWLGLHTLEPRVLLSASAGDCPIISEFMARNTETLADQDGAFSDWFELYNPTGEAVDLTGWFVTDDAGDLTKWAIPAVSLNPGEYKIVFASGKDRTDPADELHTNFGLNDAGEFFALVKPDGVSIAHSYDPFPAQEADISYGIAISTDTLLASGSPVRYHVPTIDDDPLGTTWTGSTFDDTAWNDSVGLPLSSLVITEAFTGGTDFIEIQNVSNSSVDTDGWTVVLNDAQGGNINNFHETALWQLSGNMAAGEVSYRTDSAADNHIGDNIFWETTGNGWAMIIDDVGNVVDYVVWGYAAGDIQSMSFNVNGFDITIGDAWAGNAVPANGSSSTSLQRRGDGDHDNLSDLSFEGPTSKGSTNAELTSPFQSGTALARTGIGFSTGGSGFTVKNYRSNVTIDNLAIAEGVIATPSQQISVVTAFNPTLNFMSTGAEAHYTPNDPFPGMAIGVDDNNFVIEATGKIFIPSAGDWTFGVNSDDGFSLDITGADDFHIEFSGVRGVNDTLGVFSVLEAGVYDVRLVSFERTGAGSMEFFAAPGSHGSFNATDFDLVGDFANGGLALAGFSDLIDADVEDQVRDVNTSLWTRIDFNVDDPTSYSQLDVNMQYNDGFIAYLNGVEVASRNSPSSPMWDSAATATRTDQDSVTVESINISQHIGELVVGSNVLAVHVLNDAVSDEDLLMVPEIVAASSLNAEQYFVTATPGAANVPGFFDFVADTEFTVDRGFFDTAFDLEITTESVGATIVYTIDGTVPTLTNGTVYTGPINISSTTVLRAAAFKAGFQPTNVDTQTYFFLNDVITQSADGSSPGPGFPTGSVNGQVIDYGMDPDIVNDPLWGPQLINALMDIPSLSLVTDIDNIFDPATGIFVNAGNRGREWERDVSFELIDPFDDGSGVNEFQVNAGIRIRGGFSRSDNNPKHSFRLFFRGEYGDSKLIYDLFEDEGAGEFDKIDLRTAQNYSWAFQNDGRNAFVRDVLSRDIQGAMGHQYTRGRFYHLYLNGQYWGLFQTDERPSASFAETYYGGAKEDYDVVKSTGSAGGYQVEATDGTLDAWMELYGLMQADFGNDSVYLQAQGLNSDGTNNPQFDKLLDIDSLIDHMVIVYFTKDRDGAGSRFTAPRTNNWFGIYDRNNPDGFKFFEHDSEHSLDTGDANMVSPKYIDHGNFNEADNQYWNPHWLHEKLMDNDEYRQHFIDRVQMHISDSGVLSTANLQAMLDFRAGQIENAIIAESARWGDAKRSTPFTKTNWDNAINTIRNWFDGEQQRLVNQLSNEGWWSSVNAPDYLVNGVVQNGGSILPTDDITVSSPLGSGTNTTVLGRGGSWHYLDNASDQGTAWRSVGFDDSLWEVGDAQLGYGDGDEVTLVDFVDVDLVTAGVQKNATTYFRTTFDVADLAVVDAASFSVLFDDGVSVFLNGKEVIRENLTGTLGDNSILFDTYAGVQQTSEGSLFTFSIDPNDLLQGENTIAVEIHQVSPTSTDISFDLEVIVTEVDPAANPIFYTLDGSDPRLFGGGINSAAILFGGSPFSLLESTAVRARVLSSGVWSPLSIADFRVNTPADATNLSITELNYNPYALSASETAAGILDEDEFEFVEFRNISDERIDLAGVVFDGDFDFTNSNVTALDAGDYVLIVRNQVAFETRYGMFDTNGQPWNIAGEFSDELKNGGEGITVLDALGQVIHDFDYKDGGSFPGRADGKGSSLEIIAEGSATDYSDGDSWRSSSEFGGSPGVAGSGADNRVVINEVLAHTDEPLVDSIELYNTTASDIDISGWFLSDNDDDYLKFRVPDGTTILAGGYVVFDEEDFNSSGDMLKDFALDAAHGDEIYLIEATLDASDSGGLIGFVDKVDFGATANGESLGRFPNGLGKLAPLIDRSLGFANGDPRIGPVIISEVMYNPPDPGTLPLSVDPNDLEFIEIYNPTASAVDLTNWVLDKAVDFDFPSGLMLESNEALLILAFDHTDAFQADKVTAFENVYGVTLASLNVVGGFQGQLSNGGDTLQLHRPDEPPAEEPNFFPQLHEDEVEYDDELPWSGAADGLGDSLHRVAIDSFGNFSTSWQGTTATPGSVDFSADTTPPTVISVDYNAGDEQRSTLTSIAVTFSEAVNTSLEAADLQIVNLTMNSVVSATDLLMSWDGPSHVATWLFPNFQGGSLSSGNYAITLASQHVTDEAGNHLDGNQDGQGTGNSDDDVVESVWRYFGDSNGDRNVDFLELFRFRSSYGTSDGEVGFRAAFDINADLMIAFADLFAFRANAFTTLDPPSQPFQALQMGQLNGFEQPEDDGEPIAAPFVPSAVTEDSPAAFAPSKETANQAIVPSPSPNQAAFNSEPEPVLVADEIVEQGVNIDTDISDVSKLLLASVEAATLRRQPVTQRLNRSWLLPESNRPRNWFDQSDDSHLPRISFRLPAEFGL